MPNHELGDGWREEPLEPISSAGNFFSGSVGTNDNRTLPSRNVETPTDTFPAIWEENSERTSPYQQ